MILRNEESNNNSAGEQNQTNKDDNSPIPLHLIEQDSSDSLNGSGTRQLKKQPTLIGII